MFCSFIRTTFVRHVSVMQVGALAQFGLSFIGSVLVARLLGPDQYGVYALAGALAGFLGLFLDAGQGGAAVVLFSRAYAEGNREEMRRVGASYLKMTFLLFLCIGLPMFILSGWFGNLLYGRTDLGLYVRLLILGMGIAALFGFFTMLLQIIRNVWALAFLETADQFLKTGAALSLLLAGFGLGGVFAGQMAGAALSCIGAFWFYRKRVEPLRVVPRVREALARVRAAPLAAFARFSVPMALDKNLAEFYHIGVLLLIGRLAQPADAGFFRIALSYVSLSAFLLGPVARLLQDQFPKDQVSDARRLRSNFIKVSAAGGALCAAAGAILVLAGPFLVGLVYGQGYVSMVPLIRAFWVYTAVIGFGVGLGSIYRTLGKVRFLIMLNTSIMLIGFPLSIVLMERYGALGAVYGFTLMKGTSTVIALVRAVTLLKGEAESVYRKDQT